MNKVENPKVFISYSWSSEDYKDWVRERVANRLIENGIEVEIDQYSLKPGQDSHAYMEKMVTDESIHKVLVIIDKKYCDKGNAREGGVGTESQIISPEVYSNKDQEKFIPIITEYDENGKPYIPINFKGRIYFDFSEKVNINKEFDRLLRFILGKPQYEKPPLGTIPNFDNVEAIHELNLSHIKNQLKNSFLKTQKSELFYINNYLTTFLNSLESYRISDKNLTENFDDTFMNSIHELKALRDDFVEVTELSINSIEDNKIYDLYFKFFEKIIAYLYPPAYIKQWNSLWFDNYRFFIYELFLYFITILIKNGKYKEVNIYLNNYYFNDSLPRWENTINEKYFIFNSEISTLEVYRKDRLKLRWKSVTAKLISDRATIPNYTFNLLMQTDFILFLSFILKIDEKSTISRWLWRPILLFFAEQIRGFELFLRSESHEYFENLKILLGINSKEELAEKWKKADDLIHIDKFDAYRNVDLAFLLNNDNLDKY